MSSLEEFASIIWAFAWLDAADEARRRASSQLGCLVAREAQNRGWFGTRPGLNMFLWLVSGYKRFIQFHHLFFVAPCEPNLRHFRSPNFHG